MPLTLVRRAGIDTLGKLEAAAPRRHAEARHLHASGDTLGAVYLYGYSVEIRLKIAYYRRIGLTPTDPITQPLRQSAETIIKTMPLLPRHAAPLFGPSAGHHVVGWATLVEQTQSPAGQLLAAHLATPMLTHATRVFTCWSEFLRYRASTPYDEEVDAMADAARWFRRHGKRLWR